MNLVVSNINHYLMVHEAFRPDMLSEWAVKYNFHVYLMVNERMSEDELIHYPNITYSPVGDKTGTHLNEFIRDLKPKKICNFIEYYFPQHLIDYDCELIYFVRSCAAMAYDAVLSDSLGFGHGMMKTYMEREAKYIRQADKVLVACPNSYNAVKEFYPELEPEIVLECHDLTKYWNVPSPTTYKLNAYYVGRIHPQKGVHNLRNVRGWTYHFFGETERLYDEHLADLKYVKYGRMTFEEYRNIILDIPVALFPPLWESNGYGVMEALCMGKVPIVQKDSGGNERWIEHGINGFIVDFATEDWTRCIEGKDLRPIMEAAKDTIPKDLHIRTLEKFVEVIT